MYNTTVAKLLAKENIEIQYGNYTTAWFDIQSRTLGLPILKDMGKDVHDLFCGHEVGHALFTPYEGWHDTPEKLDGCPRTYINVVEDARIEKKIRTEYPGLVGPMARGYKVLADEDFFGDLSDIAWDKVKLIDKINLKAKLGSLINVPFIDAEYALFKKTMHTETFAEVLDVVREILAYTKEVTPELIQQPEPAESSSSTDETESSSQEDVESAEPSGHDDYENPEANQPGETEDEEDSSEESQETTGNSSGSEDETEDSNNNEKEEISTASKQPESNIDEDVSVTDLIFRDSEERLIESNDKGQQTILGRDLGKNTVKETVVPFKELMRDRGQKAFTGVNSNILDDYAEYTRNVKKSVAVAVKEFEMKKAAYQWQRASSAKTGSLDLNALHAYKTNDDIFKRVTQLANSKNHGMMMIIDYSGSMASTLPQVLDQLIHLVTFCKAVNIPFDVYAFTTHGMYDYEGRKQIDGEVEWDNLVMPQLISSTLKKAEYELALKHLYARKIALSNRYGRNWDEEYFDEDIVISRRYESWGSTPLNTALMTAHHLIKDFRKKNAVEKMNLVVLSDGDSNGLRIIRDYNLKDKMADTNSWSGPAKLIVDGKMVKSSGRRTSATTSLLENLQKRYGVTTLGFFIAQDRHDWTTKIHQMGGRILMDDMRKQYTKNKVAIKDNALGYNKFFMLKPNKALDAQTEEFGEIVNEEMTTAQIRNSFKKYSKGKKNSKVLMKQFGGIVA